MDLKVELEKCKEERKIEVDRYYQTVQLTLGLKDFLESSGRDCRFVSAEPRFFHDKKSEEVMPDMVLQYSPNRGILCEIKTSLPKPEGYLFKAMKQIEKYSLDITGWDTPNRRVSNHDILLLCHALDSDRIVRKVEEWVSSSRLQISKKLCIAEWSMIVSPKVAEEVILIRHCFGETDCPELNRMLRENITINVQEVTTKYEHCKFTRREPPEEYVMVELWQDIFPEFSEKTEDFTVSIDDVLRVAYQYYIPWSNLNGEFSQVRKRWIKKALLRFCDIDLAIQNQENPEMFQVFRGRQIQKEFLDYLVESICRQKVREVRQPFKEEKEEGPPQKSLVEFFSQDA